MSRLFVTSLAVAILCMSCGPSGTSADKGDKLAGAITAPAQPVGEPEPQPKPDFSSFGSGPNGEGAFVYQPWLEKALAAEPLYHQNGEFSKKELLQTLQVHTFLLKYAPAEYFKSERQKAYFASIFDCKAFAAEAIDEFGFRKAVAERSPGMFAAVAAMPDPTLKSRRQVSVSQYDFSAGQFNLKISLDDESDGFPIDIEKVSSRQRPMPGRDWGFKLDILKPARIMCAETSGAANLPITLTMEPWYFTDLPETLKMDEASAESFARSLGPDRKLIWDLESRAVGNGVRDNRGDLDPCDENYHCGSGPFIKLAVSWTLKTPDGAIVAKSTNSQSSQ